VPSLSSTQTEKHFWGVDPVRGYLHWSLIGACGVVAAESLGVWDGGEIAHVPVTIPSGYRVNWWAWAPQLQLGSSRPRRCSETTPRGHLLMLLVSKWPLGGDELVLSCADGRTWYNVSHGCVPQLLPRAGGCSSAGFAQPRRCRRPRDMVLTHSRDVARLDRTEPCRAGERGSTSGATPVVPGAESFLAARGWGWWADSTRE